MVVRTVSYYQCERVITDRDKVEYCERIAEYISPPGVHTKRIIRVCSDCKRQLEKGFTAVSLIMASCAKTSGSRSKGCIVGITK